MHAAMIQRQYDEVIASHYDLDPQSLIADSQEKALLQIQQYLPMRAHRDPLCVFDLGVGTGKFLAKLRNVAAGVIQPYGLDLSQKMIEIARTRLPDLTAAVDDAANLDAHFTGVAFDLVCTHFITGFIPMTVLAPKIWEGLAGGGYWSFVGGTKAGFPMLQHMARGKLLNWVLKGRTFNVGDFLCNPADQDEVADTLEEHGFDVCACETFEPKLHFKNFNDFYAFAYLGGWLTPIIEALDLHRHRPVLAAMLNAWLFPLQDHHNIVIALARKPLTEVRQLETRRRLKPR